MEDKLATKQDIRELATTAQLQELKAATTTQWQELRAEMQGMESNLRLEIQATAAGLESRLTTRMGAMFVASVTLLTAVIAVVHNL